MSTKTAKVLHVIAFILILLTMAFVLVSFLMFKTELLNLVHAPQELLDVSFTPWGLIIEVGFILLLALIWLLVLMNRPGRGATISMTVIMAILLIGYFAVGKPFLNVWLQQKAAAEGVYSLSALSQFNYVASTIANFAFVPGLVLMVLSLGSACGKNFKLQEEEVPEPVQQPYVQRPVNQPVQQTGMQRPQYSQPQSYQQNYGQKPAMQNTGYIPKVDAMQNTGYIPKTDLPSQNTGYIPKVDMPSQNTGYIPKVEAPSQNTVSTAPAAPVKTEETPAPAVIYPWMKAAGAPAKPVVPDDIIPTEEPVPETLDEMKESEN